MRIWRWISINWFGRRRILLAALEVSTLRKGVEKEGRRYDSIELLWEWSNWWFPFFLLFVTRGTIILYGELWRAFSEANCFEIFYGFIFNIWTYETNVFILKICKDVVIEAFATGICCRNWKMVGTLVLAIFVQNQKSKNILVIYEIPMDDESP